MSARQLSTLDLSFTATHTHWHTQFDQLASKHQRLLSQFRLSGRRLCVVSFRQSKFSWMCSRLSAMGNKAVSPTTTTKNRKNCKKWNPQLCYIAQMNLSPLLLSSPSEYINRPTFVFRCLCQFVFPTSLSTDWVDWAAVIVQSTNQEFFVAKKEEKKRRKTTIFRTCQFALAITSIHSHIYNDTHILSLFLLHLFNAINSQN